MYSGLVTLEDTDNIRKNLRRIEKREPTPEETGQLTTLLTNLRGAIKDMQEKDVREADKPTLSTDDFLAIVGAYGSDSRYFHTIKHLMEMTGIELSAYTQLAKAFEGKDKDGKDTSLSAIEILHLQKINLLAGFFHDQEYVHVDGKITKAGSEIEKEIITREGDKYVIAAHAGNNPNIQMVMDVFGFKAGDVLNPFGGMNEFLSAVSAAQKLEKAGLSKKDILSVVASIEATVPFKPKDRMEELRKRITNIIGEETRTVDAIVANATLLANRDVIGLIGPSIGKDITIGHIRAVLEGTENLHREEVPQLRVTKPGAYPPMALLIATNKQYGLFAGVLGKESKSQILHGVKILSNGNSYPPDEEVAKYEATGREMAKYMAIIMRARVAAMAIVTALAEEKGLGEKFVCDLLHNGAHPGLAATAEDSEHSMTPYEKMAYEVLSKDRNVSKHDTKRSNIAAALVKQLRSEGLYELVGQSPFINEKEPDPKKDSKVVPIVRGVDGASATFLANARKVAHDIVEHVDELITNRNRSPWADKVNPATLDVGAYPDIKGAKPSPSLT